jgi:hypothetical protein
MPFKKGHKLAKGRPKNSKNERTLEWEALGESITTKQAGKFNEYLNNLWDEEPSNAANLFLQTLEYFKPKQARTEIKQEGVQQLEVVIKRK